MSKIQCEKKVRLLSLTSNIPLAEKISKYVGIPLTPIEVTRFKDKEVSISLQESVRGAYVYLIQSTNEPANENYMELFITVDALKRASAKEITVIMPYYGYSRQDRKARSREPITAKLIADLLQTAGVNRVVSIDLHAAQIQGFFNIPIDNFSAVALLAQEVAKKKLPDLVAVSPDHGGTTRALKFSKHFDGIPLVIIDKRRPKPNVAEVFKIVGDIKDKNAVIIDDIIDTAGTLCAAAKALIDNGAKSVYAVATHGVLSGEAIQKIEASPIKEVIVTDTIPLKQSSPKIRQISVSEMLARAISCIINEETVSDIFELANIKK